MQSLHYESAPIAPHSTSLQRYFVYGIDDRSQQNCRVTVKAMQMPSVAAAMHAASLLPLLIVVEPDPSFEEPPPLETWIADAQQTAGPAMVERLENLTRWHGRSAGYILLPPITVTDHADLRSIGPGIVVKEHHGYNVTRVTRPHPVEAFETLARWGQIAGLGLVTIFMIPLIAIFGSRQAVAPADIVAGSIMAVVILLPGIAMMVTGLKPWRQRRWIPLFALPCSVVPSAALALSAILDTRRGAYPAVVIGLVLLSLTIFYGAMAIRAMLAKQPRT